MIAKVAIFALFVACVYANACNNPVCVPLGGTCYPQNDANTLTCQNSYCKIDTSDPTKIAGACAAYLATGADCSGANQYYCNPSSAACVNNVCKALTYTAGAGAACDAATMCASNAHTCGSAGTCVPLPNTVGASCTDLKACAGALECDGSKCIAAFSVAVGSTCATDDSCVAGSFCGSEGKCVAAFTSSNAACNYTNPGVCSNANENCQCMSYAAGAQTTCTAPVVNTQNYNTLATTALNCARDANCNWMDLSGSCGSCKDAICRAYQAAPSAPNTGATSCSTYTDPTSTFCAGYSPKSSSASTLAVGAAATIVAAALMM